VDAGPAGEPRAARAFKMSDSDQCSVLVSEDGEVRFVALPPGKDQLREVRLLKPIRLLDPDADAALPTEWVVFSHISRCPVGAAKAIVRLTEERDAQEALLDECYRQLQALSDAPYRPWPEALCQLFDALLRRHWDKKIR
jgi:hypothetical protein